MVALDRAVRCVNETTLDGPLDRWRATAAEIRAEVCDNAWDASRSTFTQSYDSAALDTSLLMIPMVGFLPPDDERVLGTVAAIERELLRDGLVMRYAGEGMSEVDGLPPGEGAFLPCSFWLADVYGEIGRADEGAALFERLLALANDVGLLAEEYDPTAARLVGNFPQAFTHLSLINTARNLTAGIGPVHHRVGGSS